MDTLVSLSLMAVQRKPNDHVRTWLRAIHLSGSPWPEDIQNADGHAAAWRCSAAAARRCAAANSGATGRVRRKGLPTSQFLNMRAWVESWCFYTLKKGFA